MPELPHPASQPRRDAGRGPRLPAQPHPGAPEPGPAAARPPRGGVGQRPLLPWRRDKAIALATSERLGHAVGVNGFFTALLRTARHDDGAELALWWPERRCAGAWGTFVRTDGYGVWAEAGRRVAFLLEHDNGTERLARLSDKLPGYARLFAAGGRRLWVLFSFPGPGREAEARRALRHPEVPVATAVVRPGASPAEAIWLPVGDGTPRRRLADLGDPARRSLGGAARRTP